MTSVNITNFHSTCHVHRGKQHISSIHSLSSVNAQVSNKVVFLGKGSVADEALVWALSSMYSLVDFDGICSISRVGTVPTLKLGRHAATSSGRLVAQKDDRCMAFLPCEFPRAPSAVSPRTSCNCTSGT